MKRREYEGLKNKKGVNPITVVFRQKTKPSHWRAVRCFRIDETPDSWAIHTKVFVLGQNYVRHMTEWFQKSLFDMINQYYGYSPNHKYLKAPSVHTGKRRGRSGVPLIEMPVVTAPLAVSENTWAEENPTLAAMSGDEPEQPPPKIQASKTPTPRITFVDDDDDDPPPPAQTSAPTSGPKKVISDKEEMAGEYNPRAHPEKIAGEIEDLVVFDDLVNSNFIASQRKLKMMQLRSRQQRGIMPTRNNPVVTGAEPG